MTSPLGKVRVALVFLFVMLAVNFLAAQRLREDAEGALHSAPDGKGSVDSEHALPEARPVGQSVSQGHGINYHGGPVMALPTFTLSGMAIGPLVRKLLTGRLP